MIDHLLGQIGRNFEQDLIGECLVRSHHQIICRISVTRMGKTPKCGNAAVRLLKTAVVRSNGMVGVGTSTKGPGQMERYEVIVSADAAIFASLGVYLGPSDSAVHIRDGQIASHHHLRNADPKSCVPLQANGGSDRWS